MFEVGAFLNERRVMIGCQLFHLDMGPRAIQGVLMALPGNEVEIGKLGKNLNARKFQ